MTFLIIYVVLYPIIVFLGLICARFDYDYLINHGEIHFDRHTPLFGNDGRGEAIVMISVFWPVSLPLVILGCICAAIIYKCNGYSNTIMDYLENIKIKWRKDDSNSGT